MMVPSVWLSVLCLFAAADFALCDNVDVDRTLRVTTLLTEPFARNKSQTTSPRQLEGYIIDLLDELSESVSDIHLHFNVTPVADGKYGDFVGRNWNGMMGEITGSRPSADMAAAPLTKTRLRENSVTFIDPAFMIFDLAILMDKRADLSGIKSIVDLAKQDKIKYGVVDGGSTAYHIDTRGSEGDDMIYYRTLKLEMEKLASVEEGVRWVRQSNLSHPFVFIGERPTMEYHASRRPCDLTTVHGSDHTGEYHLAVRQDLEAEIQEKLAEGLNKLNESGKLTELFDRWLNDRSECNDEAKDSSTSPVSTSVAVVTAVFLSVASVILSRGE